MALKLTNNATSRLSGAVNGTQTTISVTAGDGAKFPALAATDFFPLTVVKADGTFEIMRATARTGDTITVTRAQEGTTALTFAPNDRVELRITAATLLYFWNPDNDGAGSGLDADTLDGFMSSQAATANTVAVRDANARLPGDITGNALGNAATATAAQGSTFATQQTAAEGQLIARLTGQNDAYVYNGAGAWGLFSASGGNAINYDRASGRFKLPGALDLGSSAGQSHTLTGGFTVNGTVVTPALNSTSRSIFTGNQTTGIATSASSLGGLEAQSNGAGAAFMAFHRPGNFGAYLGLDTDSVFKVGGWSFGAVAYPLLYTGSPTAPGAAPVYACRAWVNFNGTNGAIRGAGNVSSVSRIAVGGYTVNFTTALTDANYGVNTNYVANTSLTGNLNDGQAFVYSFATTSFTMGVTDGGGAIRDGAFVHASVFR